MSSHARFLRVAVNTPLRRLFDYLPPARINKNSMIPGQRLRIPFGKGKDRVGLLIEVTEKSRLEDHRLKHVKEIIDEKPLLPRKHLEFLIWASQYYHHPVGEVVLNTLPALLGRGAIANIKLDLVWRLTDPGRNTDITTFKNAKKQAAILSWMKNQVDYVTRDQFNHKFTHWQAPVKTLVVNGLIETISKDKTLLKNNVRKPDVLHLNNEQSAAVNAVRSTGNRYQAYLLNGVTGSGKTEVYIECIEHILETGKQSLVLLPEIGLTPQFIQRIQERLHTEIAVMHSGLSDRERLNAWLNTRSGDIKVLLGTRSAIWTPFLKLGLIIVDEEHDLSYKQQDGFRYSARDMALALAQREKIPVILGSATPSMESIQNITSHRYTELKLTRRIGSADLPQIEILDIRKSRMYGAISQPLIENIGESLKRNQQVLLFLNRRGYSPVMLCHDCGWISTCPRCDTHMTWHKSIKKLCCHRCSHEEKSIEYCPDCNSKSIIEIGHGTQRLTETLENHFPDANILRIDRDSTRRKGSIQSMISEIQSGKVDILIGTQMLTKGHHFPRVNLVGIIDADSGLHSTDYRTSERLAQIILQVSGRAGRVGNAGKVLVQTHFPGHPLLNSLKTHNYNEFSRLLLAERKEAILPPFSFHSLLRAEAHDINQAKLFLQEAKDFLKSHKDRKVQLYGPFPAPIQKLAGRYRMQLLIQADERKQIRQCVAPLAEMLEQSPARRRVRWSIDIDPQEML